MSLRRGRIDLACSLIADFLCGDVDLFTFGMAVRRELTDDERAGLLGLMIVTFPPDQAEELISDALAGSGYPVPPLTDDYLADARLWASRANPREISAWLVACLEQTSPARRSKFLDWAFDKYKESKVA